MAQRKSFCRFCHANCAIEVEVDGERPIAIRGDPDDPVFAGYTCLKGRQLAAQHTHPARLRHALRRGPDGAFAPIDSHVALDEIAEHLRRIIDRDGPRAVASYMGTYAFQNSAALPVAQAWHQALGSPSYYTSVTLDQPAKTYAWSRVGAWEGGAHGFDDADVLLLLGNNPLVSHYSPPGGLSPFSPSRALRAARARGMKLIVVDPRRTETARRADLHLQARPGEDPVLLAAMLGVILDEGLEDRAFCADYVQGLEALRAALAPYTPAYAANRAGVAVTDLMAAARLFAHGPRGIAATGTGPEMAPRGTLTEHLVIALNVVCGRYCRAGEWSPVPKVLSAAAPRRARVLAPAPLWGDGCEPARVRGLTRLGGVEMPCATLAEEILLPGPGRIRALLCIGGNPLTAWPDQALVRRALESLELLVCVDVRLTESARRAHYVIAPSMCLERDDITLLSQWWYEQPYARYTEAVIAPPGDVLDEWELYWELGRRLGLTLELAGGALDMRVRPDKFTVLESITAGSRVPLAQVREATRAGGRAFEQARVRVQPRGAEDTGRFELAPPEVLEELAAVRAEALDGDGRRILPGEDYTHLLVCRRTRQYYNSTGQDLEALQALGTTNYAWMHPRDMAQLNVGEDTLVEISARPGTITGVVRASADVRRGVVSMAHGFGGAGRDAVRDRGSSTNRLVDPTRNYDPITGMARQSAIPVVVRPVGD